MKRQLSPENIDLAAMEVEAFLTNCKADKKDVVRIRLGVEENLIRFARHFGNDAVFDLKTGRILGRTKIVISVPGESYDPVAADNEDDETSVFMRSMLTTLGKRPVWNYIGKINVLSFSIDRKPVPSWVSTVAAIVLAVLCGLLIRGVPDHVKTFIQAELLSPLLDTFLGFLNAVAGPMIFLSVVWGIYSMGDAATFSTIGKKLAIRFAAYICIITSAVALLVMPFFHMNYGGNVEGTGLLPLYALILDVVPDNMITPFIQGNTLQILFLGVITGVTMIVLGEKMRQLALVSEQLNLLIQRIMGALCSFVPIYIFGSLLNIMLTSDISTLLVAGKFFFLNIAAYAVIIILQMLYVSFRIKVSPVDVWKRSFETLLIALTTASSSAAFACNLRTCTEKYGIDPKLANFGVPFMQILHKPGVSVVYFISAVSMAEYSGITISVSWVVMALILSIVLASASPPIPGGSLASYSVLFAQLGIPAEHLALVLSLDSLLDFFRTATSVTSGQLLLVDEACSQRLENVLFDPHIKT